MGYTSGRVVKPDELISKRSSMIVKNSWSLGSSKVFQRKLGVLVPEDS